MIRLHFLIPIALAAAAMMPAGADAGFQVTLMAEGSSLTVGDNTALDQDPALGSIALGSAGVLVDSYLFRGAFADTNSPGSAIIAYTNAGATRITGNDPGLIQIVVSASDFTQPNSSVMADSGSTFQFKGATTIGNTADHSFLAYYDASNSLSTTGAGQVIGSGSRAGIAYNAGNSALQDHHFISVTGPYALDLVLRANMNNGGVNEFSLDGALEVRPNPVPAPAGLTLVLAGAPVLGLGAWLRKRRLTAAGQLAA